MPRLLSVGARELLASIQPVVGKPRQRRLIAELGFLSVFLGCGHDAIDAAYLHSGL
jgi:hypothetical protein